ncbi:MAG: GNAT family protein [Bacteroidota bacterium]
MTTQAPASLLRGARVQLTALQLDNIHTHFEWNNDPELNYYDSEIPHQEESFREFKGRFEQFLRARTDGYDFEIHSEGNGLIGVAYIGRVDSHNRHCAIGLTIGDRAYWGQGYGREVLALLLQHCFEQLGMHRVSAEAFEYNDAWRRLVQWAGFRHEGTQRDYLFRDGRFWDREDYGLLAHEYGG